MARMAAAALAATKALESRRIVTMPAGGEKKRRESGSGRRDGRLSANALANSAYSTRPSAHACNIRCSSWTYLPWGERRRRDVGGAAGGVDKQRRRSTRWRVAASIQYQGVPLSAHR